LPSQKGTKQVQRSYFICGLLKQNENEKALPPHLLPRLHVTDYLVYINEARELCFMAGLEGLGALKEDLDPGF